MGHNSPLNILLKEIINLINKEIRKELFQLPKDHKVEKLNSIEKPHLTRKETADFFDISVSCLDNWCNQGKLKPFKVGHRTYFKKSDLLKVLFDQ